MGKSMSTAKNVTRSPIVKTTSAAAIQTKPNQKIVSKNHPIPPTPIMEYMKKANTVDKSFNDRLKQVFVTSVNNNPNMDVSEESLPKDRKTPYTLTPHTQEADQRKPNTLLVDDVKMILINFRANPEKWTIDYIASRYNISSEKIEKLVGNYGSLETFYAKGSSESDKYIHKKEPSNVKVITADTSIYEMEDILTQGQKSKWLTKEEAHERWKY